MGMSEDAQEIVLGEKAQQGDISEILKNLRL
jgi:hypothetical protein